MGLGVGAGGGVLIHLAVSLIPISFRVLSSVSMHSKRQSLQSYRNDYNCSSSFY